ncbi:translation initiation factor 2, alpha subunit [Kipferlia bialata]|uniref:Translation initiation factor 2, alpha subunit n=1 Tax=Kipferlia bialata TaxID=797122 RepID=A0A9K3CVF1_9EUKA|nr:translation initiation factor 2, alpha subunit [Kipferlia bialata]|eukprot:g5457.t1
MKTLLLDQVEAMADENDQLDVTEEVESCRMYPNELPQVGDTVVVRIVNVTTTACYVVLLEYNNIQGMILFSEFTRRRMPSVSKYARVGRTEVLEVLRVDPVKKYIDLSKRNLQPDDTSDANVKFQKSKIVHSIMRRLATIVGKTHEETCEAVSWPVHTYGTQDSVNMHAYDILNQSLSDPSILEAAGITDADVRAKLLDLLRRKLAPKQVEIRAEFEVTCYSYLGIEGVRQSLMAGEEFDRENSPSDAPLEVRLVVPPKYTMGVRTFDAASVTGRMKGALGAIAAKAQEVGGTYKLLKTPYAVRNSE